MVRLNVLELLKQRGHTKYWLYKQLGMSYQNFSRMVNNQTASIRYENIEAICQLLECTPNELFLFEEDIISEWNKRKR
ncbi:MAG: helix-turn-helix transcriptional regulator [Eubacteriales bacterium]|nr:helix-turn-helix transcriptional regulator [Eubacteriales bacterium]